MIAFTPPRPRSFATVVSRCTNRITMSFMLVQAKSFQESAFQERRNKDLQCRTPKINKGERLETLDSYGQHGDQKDSLDQNHRAGVSPWR